MILNLATLGLSQRKMRRPGQAFAHAPFEITIRDVEITLHILLQAYPTGIISFAPEDIHKFRSRGRHRSEFEAGRRTSQFV